MTQRDPNDPGRTPHIDPTNPHRPDPVGTHPYDEKGHAVGRGPRRRGATVGLYLLLAIAILLGLFWFFGSLYERSDVAPEAVGGTVEPVTTV